MSENYARSSKQEPLPFVVCYCYQPIQALNWSSHGKRRSIQLDKLTMATFTSSSATI